MLLEGRHLVRFIRKILWYSTCLRQELAVSIEWRIEWIDLPAFHFSIQPISYGM